jgi:putative MFS transporter
VSRGRLAEAEAALSRIEQQVGHYLTVPPFATSEGDPAIDQSAKWTDLFRGVYLRRTILVWSLWFCSFLVSYGLTTWLPTIYRTVFGIPIQTALILGVFGNLLALIGGVICALSIDRIGRRVWMSTAFFVACTPMFILAALGGGQLITVVVLTGVAAAAINTIAISLYLYTPEIYPTRMRARGTSWATFWPRFATITGAYLIGMILPTGGLSGVFLLLAGISILGGIFCYLGATETQGQILEQISP